MTYTVGLHLQDRYNTGYRQYNLTVHKGNAQDNTTPVKWHHRKKLAIHVDVFVSVAVRGASFITLTRALRARRARPPEVPEKGSVKEHKVHPYIGCTFEE